MENSKRYRELREIINRYTYASNIMSFDEATVCPKLDKEYSMECSDYFMMRVIEIQTGDEYYNLLAELINNPEDLTEVELLAVKKEYKDITKDRIIPNELRFKLMECASKTTLLWQQARESMDFSSFEDSLASLISLNKEVIKLEEGKYHGYDVILTDMEPDFSSKEYDSFFNRLECEIVPLVKKILALPKKYNTKIRSMKFSIPKQREITKLISKHMGYTDMNGYIGETIHPFTIGINTNDVRTTTSYDEGMLFSNLFSVMHEVGHATYELQVDKKYNNTVLSALTSMGIHESQSRFYENYLGRSREFVEWLYPILKDLYPNELKEFTLDDIYYYINDVEAQPRRTEADELTYPLHILIRYKVEKKLFNGEIEPKDIEATFNSLMKEYLGIEPTDKRSGCYQDIHWCSGFGYFPTYALGSAISAMCYHYMAKDIDIKADMRRGDFSNINKWLGEHIHRYGMSLTNLELIRNAFGEDFNPDYYISYLKNKFKSIYNL